MPSTTRLEGPSFHLGFAPVLVANVLPLVGAVRFGWDPATIVAIYALELLLAFPLSGVKALFARRSPRTDLEDAGVVTVSSELTEKRGSVDVAARLPPVYPRNLPFVTAMVFVATWFAIVIGIVFADLFGFASRISRPAVVLGAGTLVVGQVIETWSDYLHGGYETQSPFTVIETPARQAFFLAFVLFTTPSLSALGLEVALGALVLGKLLVEWSAYRATHRDGGGGLTGWLAGPESDAGSREPVSVPDAGPAVSVPTDGRTVLLTAIVRVLGRDAPFHAVPFLFVWLLSLALLGDASPVAGIAAGLVVVALFVGFLTANVIEYYLQYGPMEYHRYGDRLVAYDTLLDEPQWSTPVDVLRDVEVVADRLPERLMDTRTVAVTTGWGDDETRRFLGPVDDPGSLVEAFELPVQSTELEPLDRRPVAVVIASLLGLLGAVVLLGAGLWLSSGEVLFGFLVYGVFGLPFVAIVLRVIWERAYPRRSD